MIVTATAWRLGRHGDNRFRGRERHGRLGEDIIHHKAHLGVCIAAAVACIAINGSPSAVALRVDGRAKTFSGGGKTFDLSKGNCFRIKLLAGPTILVKQLPIIDVVDDDPAVVRRTFLNAP